MIDITLTIRVTAKVPKGTNLDSLYFANTLEDFILVSMENDDEVLEGAILTGFYTDKVEVDE